jgi:fatty-acyl-CoA synthase
MIGNPSYVRGANAPALMYETIGHALERAAQRWPDRDALVVRHQQHRLSYAQLNAQVDELAAGLLALGLEPGERIGIWAPNCLEWTLTQYAAAKAGLILVCVNPAYRVYELEYALQLVGCKALVTCSRFKSSDYLAMLLELVPEVGERRGHLQSARLPALRTIITLDSNELPGCMPFADIASLAGPDHRARLQRIGEGLQPDDPINIQFTSGTTGAPKGATLSHFNILNNGYQVGEAMHISEADRICIPVPLYHCFGMVMGNLNCLTHGAAAIYPSAGFDPRAVLEAIQAERCTALYGVPTMFIAELEEPEFGHFDLSSLRTGIMAGAPCPITVMQRVIERMHVHEITIAYGMTETSPVSFQSEPDDPIERRVSTVGKIHPHLEVKVVDDRGRIVPRGVSGELCTRGYSVMHGYWAQPDRTAEVIDAARWMHTGDLATIDDDGYCNIVGRIKDMVIRGGENIYPREVEEFLFRHPKIHAVACFGVPDPVFGEVLCAWIELRAGMQSDEDEIKTFCANKIAHYKVPRYIRFVDEFPLTATGKVQKFVMRERMARELDLGGIDVPSHPA